MTTEQGKTLDCLGCQLSSKINYDLHNKFQRINFFHRKIKPTLLNESQQDIILELYKVTAINAGPS